MARACPITKIMAAIAKVKPIQEFKVVPSIVTFIMESPKKEINHLQDVFLSDMNFAIFLDLSVESQNEELTSMWVYLPCLNIFITLTNGVTKETGKICTNISKAFSKWARFQSQSYHLMEVHIQLAIWRPDVNGQSQSLIKMTWWSNDVAST